jgi:hypothetical protein
MSQKTETCKHTPCQCRAHKGTGFCSDYCQQAKARRETGCQCPHVRCKPKNKIA